MKLKIGLCALFFLALGCQTTGYVIEDSDYSVKQHRVAISNAFGKVRAVSQNGREVYSFYHDRKLKIFEVTNKTKERLYTKAVVLGSRRPYKVSVEVHIERRDPDSGRFEDVGLDENLARTQAMAIKKMLNQSRDETSTIDVESPF